MHYRFRYFPFSRYFKKEPEIILDAPFRVNPNTAIPISLLIKDADIYPIQLMSVSLIVNYPSGHQKTHHHNFDQIVGTHWFSYIFFIHPQETGNLEIQGTIEFNINGKRRVVNTHNIKTTPKSLLHVCVDQAQLPGSDSYYWGDLHYHSNYTEDFVEFGAPLETTNKTASALGLDFLAITDHSYDLDDKYGSWVETDEELTKWKDSREEIRTINTKNEVLLIPGEEVTVKNAEGRNVHLLVMNHESFIPGSGDGAEKWSNTTSEYSIEEVISIAKENALVIASHPFVPFSKLEQRILNRGKWEDNDIIHENLHGLQILNGEVDESFDIGLKNWIHLLLSGKKIFIYAGNDAHGNFNQFHQIKIPMLSTWTHRNQILGQCRTGIIKKDALTLDSSIDALQSGKCIITDGPALILEIEYSNSMALLGDSIQTNECTIHLNGFSTEYFGSLSHIRLIHGIINSHREKTIIDSDLNGFTCEIIEKLNITFSGYFRAEILTSLGKRAYTNPIWVSPK
ncbi:MAG: CehA/McbA family metallohydrolase [Candidatus Marinimicrobia bacterium]|nr:CehA/McbA family metallohydrolase [Candidatus Neomarinimicrobiota bacterium]